MRDTPVGRPPRSRERTSDADRKTILIKKGREQMTFSGCLDADIQTIEKRFAGCADIVSRTVHVGESRLYLVYVDSMIDRDLVEGEFIKNMMYGVEKMPKEDALGYVKDDCMPTAGVNVVRTVEEGIDLVLGGDTLALMDGCAWGLVISSKKLPLRGVQTAETEATLRGPKDSFTESMRVNTVLIRRRIRDTNLKTIQKKVGRRSRTDVTILYMEDIVRPGIVAEVERRMDAFEIDGIFDSGSLEQLIEKKWYSPFPQFQSTERPDKTASALLEGRVAVVVDNSPMVLLLPTTLNYFFQASDDYYNRWGTVCFVRVLRYIAAILAMILPALYIGVACYHPDMLPTNLELSFAASRYGVPFPMPVEVLLMELAFELLREAGIRLPGPMGSALGIVGGLIIGQAAVDANIVSPIVVIVVALTALASFTIPNEGFASAFRLVKFYLIFLSTFLGLYGLVLGIITVFIHLASLESFGIPYLMPFAAVHAEHSRDMQDSIVRKPLFMMKKRPIFARGGQRTRYRKKEKGGDR